MEVFSGLPTTDTHDYKAFAKRGVGVTRSH